jgi:phosphoribosylaminoimidazole-succinocarboxamide synthase
VLNRLAAFWFERTRAVAPNHMLGMPDPNVLECVECAPLPVELVVRAYLTGTTSTSILTHYEAGSRVFAGHRLPDGLARHARLPEPILTPATKAPKGEHDRTVSREEILAEGKISPAELDRAGQMALALFAEGQRVCAARGLVLVDTKYEVGKAPSGEIVLIDEIHTPDSSRFWVAGTLEERLARGDDPETLDMDHVRRWYKARGYTGDGPPPAMPDDVRVEAARRYIEAYERITGTPFVPDTTPPLPRIEAALARAR